MNEQDLLKAMESLVGSEGGCPSAEVLFGFITGKLQSEFAETVRSHLIGCASCVETWRDLRGLVGIARANAGAGNVVSMENKGRLRPGRALPALAAAASIIAAASIGVNLLQWRGQKAPAGVESTSPRTAALLDLAPESLALRGGSAPALSLESSAGGPIVLILNTARPIPGNVEILLKAETGDTLWSRSFSDAPLAPLTLVVPGNLLTPGRYSVEVKTTSPPAVLDTYRFQVR